MRKNINDILRELKAVNRKGNFELVGNSIKITGVNLLAIEWPEGFPYYSDLGIISDGRGNEVRIIWG